MHAGGGSPAYVNSEVMVALMGATGTGKSTFINLLTNDDRIKIGHRPESETFDIQTAEYRDRDRRITLVDIPGFDDSRDGVTDTDILEKIVRFLEPETGGRKLNGIIYMHRISDPRVGGVARKNIRMFEALCGKQGLCNVCIVTTNWSRVSEQEGSDREVALKQGAFQPLLGAGANMCRHANTVESAQQIMSTFTSLPPVTLQIQEELRTGKQLADTSAGMVLTAEMREMQMKHEKELADLKTELEEAAKVHDDSLRAELERERQAIQEKMVRVDDDRKRLGRPLQQPRAGPVPERRNMAELHETAREAAKLQVDRDGMARAMKEPPAQPDTVKKQREELETAQRACQKAIQEVSSRPGHESRRPRESSYLTHEPSDQSLGQRSENGRQQPSLRPELERERQAIQKMARFDDDRKRLGRPLQQPRAELAPERSNTAELHGETAREVAKLQVDRDETARAMRELWAQLDAIEKQRLELEAAQRARQMAIQDVPLRPPSAYAQGRESRRSYESSHLSHEPSDHSLGQSSENKRQQLDASEADLRRRLKKVCEKEYELEDRLCWATKDEGKGRRGGSYLGEAKSIVRGSVKTGGKYGGTVGAAIGGAVGLVLTPLALLEPDRGGESRGG